MSFGFAGWFRYNPLCLMSWLTAPRVPESEVMAEAEEVEAYASAAAQTYLDSLDRAFV